MFCRNVVKAHTSLCSSPALNPFGETRWHRRNWVWRSSALLVSVWGSEVRWVAELPWSPPAPPQQEAGFLSLLCALSNPKAVPVGQHCP